ncbi:hypothetical protein MXB_2182, partial [Myxobolus squamalis]
NSKTDRLNFCHYSRRLIKLCLVEALSLIDFPICTVSILRAGNAFEYPIKEMLPQYSFGKILIQTNKETNEPEFHYLKLPHDIKDCHVLLFDPTISSGASEFKDHNVDEEDIIMITILLTPIGVQSILNAFPKVKIVTAALDDQINDDYHIIPGLGNFGKRFYG